MEDYYDDYDYDNGFGGVDMETFQMYGYGGFGYDTSDVKPDEKEGEMVKAAKSGDVDKMKRLLRNKGANPQARAALLNQARRWTEVDYRMSGFTKEYEWFGLTPLATAALGGQVEAVEILLEEGADPTLSGCLTDDVYYDSFSAAQAAYEQAEQTISRIVAADPTRGSSYIFGEFQNPQERADHLFQKLENARKSRAMVEACKAYWKNAPYYDARYSSTSRREYPNKPTDSKAMLEALETAKQSELSPEDQVKLDERKVDVANKLTLFQQKEKSERQKVKAKSESKKAKAKPESQKAKSKSESKKGKVQSGSKRKATSSDGIQTGIVKFFSSRKGYGFITPDDDTEDDVFVHQTSIQKRGFRSLLKGERVEFRVEMDEKGRRKAVHVTGPNGRSVLGARNADG